jgi:phospholipid/cholesterol/gamma-HCH transport system ATP-binding protein
VDAAISVRGLVTRIGGRTLHEGLDLDVRRGEVMGLVGGSGTGKSVLLRAILGLIRPAAGRIVLLGVDATGLPASRRDGLDRRCGVLFQDGALFSSLTVAENVEVPLREHADLPPALLREVARIKIELAGLPPDAANKRPAELSGGMRKRAGLARALALDPEILFLDEPTAGLDPIGASAFDRLVRTLQRSLGLTVVMVTHDLDSLVAVCDRISVLLDRKVVTGTLAELAAADHPWIRDYFHGPRGRAAADAAARAEA